jgi:hypothetical protein
MKTKWFLLITLLVVSFALALACGGGDDDDDDATGDDDDDDDDDNNDDDTAGDDDDDQPGNLTVSSLDQGVCLDDAETKAVWDPYADPTDVVQVAWEGGVLKVENLFAYVNCCAEMEVTADAAGSTVTITEIEGGEPCDCMCPMDLAYEIDGLAEGNITLNIERQTMDKGQADIFSLDLELGSANVKWFVPFGEVLLAGDTAADPFELRFAACNLYHMEDQVFMVRNAGNLVHLFAYDWLDIDNPGSFMPNCQTPVWVTVGSLASGDYTFGAPSYNEGAWSMLTVEATIE